MVLREVLARSYHYGVEIIRCNSHSMSELVPVTNWMECMCIYQVVLQLFDASELELLISGMPEIDIDDWAAHTVLQPGGYAADSPQVVRATTPYHDQFVRRTCARVCLDVWECVSVCTYDD
eukprot:COSAG02_NODE_1385_length_12954_cov_3.484250_7_plen_121_part_00